MSLDNPAELFKSAFCQLSEEVTERVLIGEVARAVIITVDTNSRLDVRFPHGLLASDVIGMMQIGMIAMINQAYRPHETTS